MFRPPQEDARPPLRNDPKTSAC